MKYNGILIFLTVILIIAILNCSYANRVPFIGANQAKTIAQDYLNSHNFPYTAITPSDYMYNVKDTQTGEIKWLPASEAKIDHPIHGGPGRYRYISGPGAPPSALIVQVNSQDGKNVGQIYVDAMRVKFLKQL